MCDTLGYVPGGGARAFFAKNSDRGPNEPQILEYIPAGRTFDSVLHMSYRDIPQVPYTHGVLLSRPVWLWGAEMGVNDCGVCIGNEAVWTLGAYGKGEVLTGMDLVRLGLERGGSAAEARDIIIEMLETYGQGGNCGFDHDFYYDNSFLIMDRSNLFVLETAGRKWAWKAYPSASISNRLCLGKDADAYSEGKSYSFAGRHTEHLYNLGSGSAPRLVATKKALEALPESPGAEDFFRILRSHRNGAEPFAKGTLPSVCMHFGGPVGDHTTASMVVELSDEGILVWATGSSCPCVSLYKPWRFGEAPAAPFFCEADESDAQAYWREREAYNRALIGRSIPADYREALEALQAEWTKGLRNGTLDPSACAAEEKAFCAAFRGTDFPQVPANRGFRKRWTEKNKLFDEA